MATQSGRILLGALDRMVYSSANYWVVMVSDLAAALAFLALGLNRFSGTWVVAGGVAIVGFMSCGLLEYVVHRWVLHGPPSLARRGHAQHHAEPRALISTPLFVIMTGALAIWGLCLGSCFRPGSPPFWSSGCMPDTTISPSCTTGNTIAATTSRASPTCDVSSDSITSITIDRS
jgi:hypothetical protein